MPTSTYYTDQITIVTTSVDKYGVTTETESALIDCRVEDNNVLIKNKNGQEVMGEMLIIMNADESIFYTSKIKD